MCNWEQAEKEAYEWYKAKYDSEAIHYGGHNSTKPDIYSPKFGYYVEVKKITDRYGARAGQFTESTIKESAVAGKIVEDAGNEALLKEFVREHYGKRQVEQFIVFDGNRFKIYSMDEFLDSFVFSCEEPFLKRGGSYKLALKYYDMVLAYDKSFEKWDNGIHSTNPSTFGTHFEVAGNEFYIDDKGLVKKRGSLPKNKTWQIAVNPKEIEAFNWE